MAASSLTSHDDVVIPAEYRDDFRAALLYEISFEAEALITHADKESVIDIPATADLLARDVRFLDWLEGTSTEEASVKIPMEDYRDLEMVAHVFESMCRAIIGPKVQETTESCPIDADTAAGIHAIASRLAWAAGQSETYHALAAEAREER